MLKISFFRKFIPLVLLLLVSFGCSQSMAEAETAEQAQPTVEEIQQVLRGSLDPSIEVTSVEPAPIPGLWEVILTVKGEVGILYIDSTKKMVVLGSIVNAETKENITKAKFEMAKAKYAPKVEFSSIPLEDAVLLGSAEAKHKVVIFDDPD